MPRNEPPIGRMGFRYEQAKEAGVPWGAIKPRSVDEIMSEIRQNRAYRAKINRLIPNRRPLADLIDKGVPVPKAIEQIEQEIKRQEREASRRKDALSRSSK